MTLIRNRLFNAVMDFYIFVATSSAKRIVGSPYYLLNILVPHAHVCCLHLKWERKRVCVCLHMEQHYSSSYQISSNPEPIKIKKKGKKRDGIKQHFGTHIVI